MTLNYMVSETEEPPLNVLAGAWLVHYGDRWVMEGEIASDGYGAIRDALASGFLIKHKLAMSGPHAYKLIVPLV